MTIASPSPSELQERSPAAAISLGPSVSAPDHAFDVVVFSEYWGMTSIAFFLMSLGTRQLVGLLPYRLQGYHLMPPLVVLLVPIVSGIGFLFALCGLKHKGTAKIGIIANGTVLFLGTLLVSAAWAWRNLN